MLCRVRSARASTTMGSTLRRNVPAKASVLPRACIVPAHGIQRCASNLSRGLDFLDLPPPPKWRPGAALDDWVARKARPISLRQLMVFGRSLTEERLISSANYVRTELPTRIAHRIRDMQRLPYLVVANSHLQEIYDLYYAAFDKFRRVRDIKTLEDNDKFCEIIATMLRSHLTVIPKLAMAALQCSDLADPQPLDQFIYSSLRSRISRRVIAEQHLSLTETFNSSWFSPGSTLPDTDFIGEVFLKCITRDVVKKCGRTISRLVRSEYGPNVPLPQIKISGHLEANFPYIISHIEYIIGELLHNSMTATTESNLRKHVPGFTEHSQDVDAQAEFTRRLDPKSIPRPPPIEVAICESAQHVTIRVSDRGGGISRSELPYLWSFAKGPGSRIRRFDNLQKVPLMAATMAELGPVDGIWPKPPDKADIQTVTAEHRCSDIAGGDSEDDNVRYDNHKGHRHVDRRKDNRNRSRETQNYDDEDDYDDDNVNDPLNHTHPHASDLSSLSKRPPHLRLGVGLPLSRVYAEYWAGKLELHSLEGYGTDVFLQISKLGNKNEQLGIDHRVPFAF